jgi:DNA-binding response OmpR family regulator
MRILIVEDDIVQSEILRKLLQKRLSDRMSVPIDIVVVSTLEEAIREGPQANVTLLDLSLPDSEASETIKSIRLFRPPVIVMTGSDDPELHARCKLMGADHVFTKGQIYGLTSQILDSLMKDVIQNHAPAT